MAHLDTLKIVAKPNFRPNTAEERRRHKLIIKLQEQQCLATAQLGGTPYRRMRWITKADSQGEPTRIQRPVRLKQWWFKDTSGTVLFSVRYGAKILSITKDNNAIEVGTLEQLPEVIKTLIQAVDAGELDTQLAAVKTERVFPSTKLQTKSGNKKN